MSRKISREVKEQAIKLVEEHGVKHSQVVSELGIGRSTLDKWLKEYGRRSATVMGSSETIQIKEDDGMARIMI